LPEHVREELKNSTSFNGTKFGKGRYKAHNRNEVLNSMDMADRNVDYNT